jgi:hypothetical protein
VINQPCDANIDVVRRNLNRKLRPGWRILKYSIVHKWKVNNAPLKPILDPFHHPALSRVLSESSSPLSREYQRALTASIHLWEWMRETNHPGWQIFCQNASSFNEESGEIAFSVLARDIASSGQQ